MPPRAAFALGLVLLACASHRPEPSGSRHDDGSWIERTVTTDHGVFVLRASRWSNLVYHLDCLANVTRDCSRDELDRLWATTLGWHDGDRDALATWHAIRTRYVGTIVSNDEVPSEPSPLPLPSAERSVETRARLAGYDARDLEDLIARLALFVDADDAVRARKVVERFAPRFDHFWRERVPAVSRAVDRFAELAARRDLGALDAKIASFYRSALPPAPREIVELVPCPTTSCSFAEQVSDHAFVEMFPERGPEHDWTNISHERCHLDFQRASLTDRRALARWFAASQDPLAVPAYGLLDEVLATGFGNGLVQRAVDARELASRLSRPLGMYTDRFIDAGARAVLPLLDSSLIEQRSVFDEAFAVAYLRALHDAFPKGMPAIAYLRPLACASDSGLPDACAQLEGAARPGYSEELDLDEVTPSWAMASTALLVRSDALSALARLPEMVDAAALTAIRDRAAGGSFVYVRRRTGKGLVFVFVARDGAAMRALIEAFAADPAPPRDGAYVP